MSYDTDKSMSTKDMSEASPTYKQERRIRNKNLSQNFMKSLAYLEPLKKLKKSYSPTKSREIPLEDISSPSKKRKFKRSITSSVNLSPLKEKNIKNPLELLLNLPVKASYERKEKAFVKVLYD
eukprot:CAMPEP_0197001324 /NCGR_PEP_ID=MMETSP1380-20130617/6042_1 /TAXON_ID=5936 /ORGANISM="Euplotes crassus, Strain CT5" /LENGTH=122 /DNA_ID=CAMNT_0042418933 /DNA_START=561 /DNA_END=929 /DNA_ORIENTATION=+